MARTDPLHRYRAKRNFAVTTEPQDGGEANEHALSFVIQKHWASRLHYDFRLELDGAMKSWAVPKGPSLDPQDKRMAVHVEDHPISYNSFEGTIPPKQYGAGKVIIWDKGVWVPLEDPRKGYKAGKLKFELRGHKLHGHWALVRMRSDEKQEPWLLIKERDEHVRPAGEYSVVDELPDSVARLSSQPRTQAGTAKGEKKRTVSALRDEKPAAAAKTASTGTRKASTSTSSLNTALEDGASPAKALSPTSSSARTKRSRAALPEGAEPAELPARLSPQLATLVDRPPADAADWLYEIKFDGYRMLARIEGREVRLLTRAGHDWTERLPALADDLRRLKLKPGWYDGEIVVLDDDGVPDFQALQNAFDTASTKQVVFFLFDLPFHDGHDLRGVPLAQRRAVLARALDRKLPDSVRLSEVFAPEAGDIVGAACHMGLEGVIGKRRDSLYSSRRSSAWIKLKCGHRQEFVIAGYTDPQGSRTGFGSLLLGVHDTDGKLQYAGNVGTGFDTRLLGELHRKLQALKTEKRPFAATTGIDRKAHWVKPKLVAEVSFAEWTSSHHVRQAVFHGLRDDKEAAVIIREEARRAPVQSRAAGRAQGKAPTHAAPASKGGDAALQGTLPSGLRVTHPERVVDASTGITKIELVRYYGLVAPLMLEHLKGRPVSLVRAPDGIGGQLFFQKHAQADSLPDVKLLDPALDPGHDPLLEIVSAKGLLSAAQMNVIELHTWNAVKGAITKPDRFTLDLDPGEGVAWRTVQQGAELVRVLLDELGLKSFLKTSGGKGLHIVVPLRRELGWDEVKDFSQAVTRHLAETLPKQFVAKSGPKNRVGKIFVDYLRNGFGATTAAAWSARARPGMGVSVPVGWDELAGLKAADQWTLRNIHTRLDVGNAPWQDYAKSAQRLGPAMKRLQAATQD
ncbi:DNA ligase D [Uliginosibacterium sp. H1]|uniref:DNA ligase D n=1 Tax=Uliginosibacterium sp. H1 TaxID=3114757 RepID=UPI002E174635|nr:DNA ligase D [Uliginosibacterium sp. H1]